MQELSTWEKFLDWLFVIWQCKIKRDHWYGHDGYCLFCHLKEKTNEK